MQIETENVFKEYSIIVLFPTISYDTELKAIGFHWLAWEFFINFKD